MDLGSNPTDLDLATDGLINITYISFCRQIIWKYWSELNPCTDGGLGHLSTDGGRLTAPGDLQNEAS